MGWPALAGLYLVLGSILIGGLLIGLPIYEFYYRRKLRASQTWQQVTGTIRESYVEGNTYFGGSNIAARVTYQYEANGVPYEGTRISFTKFVYARRRDAQAVLLPYRVHSAVTVYFDPANPADSVLVREYRSAMLVIVFVYCCGALIVLCLLVLKHSAPVHHQPVARTQNRVEPYVPPQRVKEPPNGAAIDGRHLPAPATRHR